MEDHAVKLDNIKKSFRVGSNVRRKVAVEDVSFEVLRGEVFGLLGPNGAGKTTTLKIMLGLVFPDAGAGTLLDKPLGDRSAHEHLGFLPEQSYFYGFLTAEKGLALYGRFFGLEGGALKKRTGDLLDLVGLPRGSHLTIDKYSKGMVQRFGIAQALLNDPDLVMLDEPSSGLDPIGQKEVRDILKSLKEEGKTIFLSSHQLSEVENICDSVCIVANGISVRTGQLKDLLKVEGKTRLTLRGPAGCAREFEFARSRSESEGILKVDVENADTYRALDKAKELRLDIVGVEPYHRSLEDLFLETIKGTAS